MTDVKQELPRYIRIGEGTDELSVPWADLLAALPKLEPEQTSVLLGVLWPRASASFLNSKSERDAAIKRAQEATEDCTVRQRNEAELEHRCAVLRAENEKLRGELAEANRRSKERYEAYDKLRIAAIESEKRERTIAEKTAREQQRSDREQWGFGREPWTWPLVTDAPKLKWKWEASVGGAGHHWYGQLGMPFWATWSDAVLQERTASEIEAWPEETDDNWCGSDYCTSHNFPGLRRCWDHRHELPAPPPSESPAETRCKHGHDDNKPDWHQVGDGAFARPFGTIRVCIDCGCLVAGGPTRCVRCAREVKPA